MNFETFSKEKSYIHSLDSRIKVIMLLYMAIITATANRFIVPVYSLGVSIILLALAQLNFKELLKRLLLINMFIFFLWITLPFSFPGRDMFSIGPLIASYEGVLYTLLITIKSNAIIIATIVLVGTIPIYKLTHTLKALKVPTKLVFLFFMTYRYMLLLYEDYIKLKNALKMRGFQNKTQIRVYKTYANLIGILIIKSYDQSIRIYQSMLSRGFKGKFSSIYKFNLSFRDVTFVFIIFCVYFYLLILN